MTLLSTNPFDDLPRLQQELDRALDAPLLGFQVPRGVFPPLNIFYDRDAIVLRAEVPGFRADQIELVAEPYTLTIKGERAPEEQGKPRSFYRRERQHGSFSRHVRLPKELDTGKAVARCRNGILTVRIPTAEGAKRRPIPIKSAA